MEYSRSQTLGIITTVSAFLFFGVSADPVTLVGQKCYACGPLAAKWFEGSTPPSCSDFDKSEKFVVECGLGYGSCSVAVGYDQNDLSRMCVRAAQNGCKPQATQSKENSKTKILYTVCTCNGQLCNEQPPKSSPQSPSTSTTPAVNIETSSVTNSNAEVTTTTETEQTTTIASTTAKLEQEKMSNETQQEPATKKPTEKSESSSAESTSVASTTVEVDKNNKEVEKEEHTLPLPAALGQNNDKKTPQKQGAPVDDEEDNTEGSGSRMDVDHKNQAPSTTTQKSTTAHQQSNTKNAASFTVSSVLTYTLSVAIVKFLN